jgi:hypothetical protein
MTWLLDDNVVAAEVGPKDEMRRRGSERKSEVMGEFDKVPSAPTVRTGGTDVCVSAKTCIGFDRWLPNKDKQHVKLKVATRVDR